MKWTEQRTSGLSLFEVILHTGWYDGPISGYAKSRFPEVGFVWFSAVGRSPEYVAVVYVLCPVSKAEFDKFEARQAEIDYEFYEQLEVRNTRLLPAWLCISNDRLASITAIVQLGPGSFPHRVPAEDLDLNETDLWLPYFGLPT